MREIMPLKSLKHHFTVPIYLSQIFSETSETRVPFINGSVEMP